jgi:hypothetical protein
MTLMELSVAGKPVRYRLDDGAVVGVVRATDGIYLTLDEVMIAGPIDESLARVRVAVALGARGQLGIHMTYDGEIELDLNRSPLEPQGRKHRGAAHDRRSATAPGGTAADPLGRGRPVLEIAATASVALAVLFSLVAATGAETDTPEAVGAAWGGPILSALIGLACWKALSRRAGLIAIIVIALLAKAGAASRIGERQEAPAELRQVTRSAGIDPIDDLVTLTGPEVRCFDAAGFDRDDMLAMFTDPGGPTAAESAGYVDATFACAPRVLVAAGFVEAFQAQIAEETTQDITTGEARCILGHIRGNADSVSAVFVGADPAALGAAMDACLSVEALAPIDREPFGPTDTD